jgi:4-hydroxybenzoate polyprenyltransferase
VLPDLDDDLATGVRGLPHRLGPAVSRLLAAGLLLAATVVLVFGPGRATAAGVIGLVVVAGLVVAGLVMQRRPGSRAAFRMTMLVALFDVALLVARGRSLG